MTFKDLNLHSKLLSAIEKAGYTTPTKIQSRVIPEIEKGHDILASAQTGTGKTAAFLLPALNRLTKPPAKEGKGPRVLILAPTRELAMQIEQQAKKYSGQLPHLKTVCIVGGVPYPKQRQQLSRPHDVLIATPGRLIDFMKQSKIQLSRIEILILDEADRMLDMGFIDPVEEIASKTPRSRQTLLFSATLHGNIVKLAEKLLKDPVEITVHAEHEKNHNIKQTMHYVDDLNHKNRLLDHILRQDDMNHTIIFTATKRHADELAQELRDNDHLATAFHGDMNQRKRTQTLAKLREGKIKILVATDVAARGIDVQSISHVINFDFPNNIEDYIHRIGRTGRAGNKGTALSFVSKRNQFLLKKVEEFLKQPIEILEIAGLEPRSKQTPSKQPKRPSFPRRKLNHQSKGRGFRR